MSFNIFQKQKGSTQGAPVDTAKKSTDVGVAAEMPKKKAAAKTGKTVVAGSGSRFADVLRNPRVTEKASILTEAQVYTFDVAPRTNKVEVMRAVEELYKVKPVKVNIVTVPRKISRDRKTGNRSSKGGGKKAYVFLKKGDTIEFV